MQALSENEIFALNAIIINLTLIRDFETSKLKDDPKLKSFLDDAENIIKQCAFVPTVRKAPPA